MPARLLLSWLATQEFVLTVEGGRQIGAAGLLHRRGGRAAVAVSVVRGWWRSIAGVSSETPPAAASRESGRDWRRCRV